MASYAQWLDPSDLSTLFQEITGASATTPSLVGDPVGTVRNKGTLGGYFVAPFTSWRPTLRQSGSAYYLEYDASVHSPVLALETTGTPTVLQLFAAARVTGTESYGRVITAYDGTGADYGSSTGWTFSRVGGSGDYAFYADSTGPGVGASVAIGQDVDFVIQTEATGTTNRARVNFGTAATGTFGSSQTFPNLSYRYLGGETPISGRLYGAVGHLGTAVLSGTAESEIITYLQVKYAVAPSLTANSISSASSTTAVLNGSESDGTQLFQASSDTIQEWDNTVDASITEAQLAPDGTSTARLFTEGTANNRHLVYEVDYNVMPANTVQTFTIYLKSNGRRYAQLLPAADGGGHLASVFVDLQDGVITDTDIIGGGANSEIIDTKVAQAANGYWKVSLVFRLHAAAVVWHVALSDRATYTGTLYNDSPGYTGNGTSGIYMWRPKVVAGNVPAVGPLILTQLHALAANSISSASSVGTPALTIAGELTPNSISSASSVGTPAITQLHALTATNISSASSVGAPALTQLHTLTATNISSASSVGTPAVTQVHALAATNISSASSVGTPAITQLHALTATSISSASSVGTPALTVAGQLVANSISSASFVGTPAITQLHALTAVSISSASSVGTPTLTLAGQIAPNSISSATSVGTPALTQRHVLTASNILSATSVGTPGPAIPADAALGGTPIKRPRLRPRARMPDTSSVETTEELEELRDLAEATTEAIGYLSLPKPERPPRTLTTAISSLAMELALPVIDLSAVSMQLAELDQMRTQLRELNRQIAERIALEEFLRAEAQDEEDALALLLA
jgi:hypothetical protein